MRTRGGNTWVELPGPDVLQALADETFALFPAIQSKNSFKNIILQVGMVASSCTDLECGPHSLQSGVAGTTFLTTLYPTSHTRQLEPKCRVG
jgi:hypothetical protein